MILLAGIPSETPLARLARALDADSRCYRFFHQRRFDEIRLDIEIDHDGVDGWLDLPGERWRLADIEAIFFRCMDDRKLPELRGEPEDSPRRRRCRALHEALLSWIELHPGRMLNRPSAMASNGSKPYQAQRIRQHGLLVPPTLVTNDPQAVLDFADEHGELIYKSMSGVRSIVQPMRREDRGRLESIRWCPTQFQALIRGTDLRVHVVGSEVFATAIASDATDYRYAQRQGHGAAGLEGVELESGLAERCVDLARGLDLPFAGIDLRLADDGRVFCFEVNPSPGYTYYEDHTGQPIARAVATHLAGG